MQELIVFFQVFQHETTNRVQLTDLDWSRTIHNRPICVPWVV